MKFNNLINPAILPCVMSFAFSANATDYNFATIKAEIAQPANLSGKVKF